DVPADVIAKEIERARPADWDDGEARQRGAYRDERGEQVQEVVATSRHAARLEEQLQPIGGRLQKAPGPDAVGPWPLLHAGLHLALEQREVGEAGEQRANHDRRLDQGLDHDFRRHRFSLQVTRSAWLTAA